MSKNKAFEFDWRLEGFNPRVRSQRRSPYCGLFALTVAIEGMQFVESKPREKINQSEQQLLDAYDKISKTGVKVKLLVEHFSNFYLTTAANYPSNIIDGLYVRQQLMVHQVRDPMVYVKDWLRIVSSESETMETAMIKAVKQQPIIACMSASAYLTYYDRPEIYKGAHEEGRANHIVVIIGYGKTEDNEKYWLVLNSWDESWGTQGCFRIARGNNACKIEEISFIPRSGRLVVDEEATSSKKKKKKK